MGLFSVCLAFVTVLGLAVVSGGAVPRQDFRPGAPGGIIRVPLKRFGSRSLSASRGLIGDDVAWVLGLPLRALDFIINVPVNALQRVSAFTDSILRYFIGAERALNDFLKDDFFGPIGNGVEDLILDVYNLVMNIWAWLFSSGPNVINSRRKIVSALSDTMSHLIVNKNLLKPSAYSGNNNQSNKT